MNADQKQRLLKLLDDIWVNMPDIDSIKEMADTPDNTKAVEEEYHEAHRLILEAKGVVEGL